MATDPPAERDGMDAYSAIVTSVAAQLTPRVAALRPRSEGHESVGSAVVLTAESHLLTNAHVVGRADGGVAEFADGTIAHDKRAEGAAAQRRYDEIGSAMAGGTPDRRYPSGVTAAAVFGQRPCST